MKFIETYEEFKNENSGSGAQTGARKESEQGKNSFEGPDTITESLEQPVDMTKLIEYAQAIGTICAGEYGIIWYNQAEKHIFVCLGDSNPFNQDDLKEFILEAVSQDYNSRGLVQVTIENESEPDGEGWEKLN
jgi:hypothetical protein